MKGKCPCLADFSLLQKTEGDYSRLIRENKIAGIACRVAASSNKRLGIVEPVFGNIRTCKRMDRFTLRGKTKVNIQWMLYCLVHNIEKIINYGTSYNMRPA
jgi:hypothetical protein